jgi:hypothetical protein
MPKFEQSDRIREIIREQYVLPAIHAGKTRLSIKAGDVLKEAEKNPNFPRSRTPMICKVLEGKKLLNENSLEIESIEGPPSRQSRTVVVHYRVNLEGRKPKSDSSDMKTTYSDQAGVPEDSAAWAKRVTGKLAGLLKEEMEAYGGGDAFMKWIRSDGEDDE